MKAGLFLTTSDYRIKEDIALINLEEFNIDSLNPLKYYNLKLFKEDFGFLAHEVQELFPFLVNGEKDGDLLQSINYSGFIALIIKEIQELKIRIKNIENKIDCQLDNKDMNI